MISLRTVKQYCKNYTEIENYQEAIDDTTEMWICHHIMEEVFTHEELKRAGWYYSRPATELIFIRESEHNGNPKLHIGIKRKNRNMIGKKYSEEHKKHMSEAQPKRYIRCVETNKIHYDREWRKLGYIHAQMAAQGKRETCKGYHFEFI